MSTEEVKLLATRPQGRLKLAYALILAGLMAEMIALLIGIALGVSAGEYWGTTKTARDGALAGSGLLSQGGSIAAVSIWLEPFKFLGIALFFAGISAALWGIIPNIRLRAQAMATVIPLLKGQQR